MVKIFIVKTNKVQESQNSLNIHELLYKFCKRAFYENA